ncbi:MAG: DNA polymerase III subunit beta [Candidatus Methylumidiphilus alinenensis]|uniref:DNA polymerase III subunit beta n=1 Tax=Candidatus Methylumidiphilus alinenensis TaxID=2202197 RepID=A0A2W4TG13_9GAMM|nr:MAG: DNA polymerase III subunit beta [Candidatus Methylumidiphilus alinenensis]
MTPFTEQTAKKFLEKANARYSLAGAILFGSQARDDDRPDSDADLAILLKGPKGRRVEVALVLADMAFDLMLETGVMIEPLPLWEEEWQHPENFNNPALLENIRREGIWL